jgi:hypothetical protein
MKGLGENSRTTEEDTDISLGVFLSNRTEDFIPVRATEMSGSTKVGDGVLLCTNVLNL